VPCVNLPAGAASVTGFWLGLWGAAVSTVLAVLRLREFFTDRGKLKFRAMLQRAYKPSAPGATTTHAPASERVVFTVTNVGRRKLRVMGFGVRMRWDWKHLRGRGRELRVFLNEDFPRDLGESETMEFDDPMYLGQLKVKHTGAAFVYDSRGECWHLPRRDLRLARNPPAELPPEVWQRRPGNAP